MNKLTDYIVPWVKASESYSSKHSDFAWNNPQITRMMSNENPIPPSKRVLDAILLAARLGNLYPGSGPELRRKVALDVNLSPENVVLGNGSTDLIDCVICAFVAPGDEVVISVPVFSMYESRTKIRGGKEILVPMTKDFYWDIDAIIDAVTPKTKLIFICSPNNPTGNQISENDLLRILELGLPTFLDEAYFELENKPYSRVYLMSKFPLMMVNRTFSKAFGLAGLRIGYLLCEENLANYLNRIRLPWNVSLLSLAAALEAFEEVKIINPKRQLILEGRDYLYEELNDTPGIRAFPTEGNFILVDASSLCLSSKEITDGMLKKNIFIRPMGGRPLLDGYVRVTVGTMEQNRRFIKSFRNFVEENMPHQVDGQLQKSG